jgi:glycosyltransferase involved in cell wall biosynthesis
MKDSRIRVLLDQGLGRIAAACNVGLESASGAFISIFNADDIYMENHLLAQVHFMKRNPTVGVVGSRVQTFGDQCTFWNLPTNSEVIKTTMLFRGAIANPTAMIRKSLLDSNRISYDLNFDEGSEDLDLWERISNHTEMRNLDFATIKYRISRNQATRVNHEKSVINARLVRERVLKRMGYIPSQKELNLHNQISDNQPGINIFEAREYFVRLKIQNLSSNHFSPWALNYVLEKEEFLILEREISTQNRLMVNKLSILSMITKHIPMKYKIAAVNLVQSARE